MATPRKLREPATELAKGSWPADDPRKSGSADIVAIGIGPEICNDLAASEQLEWLVTNGIGGFASGTIAGSATRRYHGLLFAALKPPAGRTLLVGGVDEVLHIAGQQHELATHRWLSGAVAPEGYRLIQSFRLDGLIPVWTFEVAGTRVEKRIWMRNGENTTFVQYGLLAGETAVTLEFKILVNYRDFHSATHAGEWQMYVRQVVNGACIRAFDTATPCYLRSEQASCELQHIWYRDFYFARERERGLDDREDQLLAATFRAQLEMGRPVTIVFSTEEGTDLDGLIALNEEKERQNGVLRSANAAATHALGELRPREYSQLVLAANQFIVKRPLSEQPHGKTIIAGYHWFGDWGRDTMIALPGLALATGRADLARELLLSFAAYVDGGMLPNNFPDSGGVPEYNTMDATLWYFEAIRRYFAATKDSNTLAALFPVLADIVTSHVLGTRYNIRVDPADGLLYGGGPGVQLTWMDAKVGDWVVTPRTGKPVEINALWLNALQAMVQFAGALNLKTASYQRLLTRANSSFGKFWNAGRNCCFDVLESPGIGLDPALRPNQIFAVSLSVSPLAAEQRKAVVDICQKELLTPVGLRSLALGERGYTGTYSGGPRDRDAAYHQGTVWGWLLGPFARAHYSVYRDRSTAIGFLEPLASATKSYGLGTLGEIFDGDGPHQPRGCIAQAWTVGELLLAYEDLKGLPG